MTTLMTQQGDVPAAERRGPVPHHVSVADVISLTARLAQLLAEEADYLAEMKVSKIEKLQAEKLFLVNALETQRKLLDKYPEQLLAISDEDREDLAAVVEVFHSVLEENHRRLLMAREVNLRVVEAITEVVADTTRTGVYSAQGKPENTDESSSLSVTLNKKV